MRNVRAVIVFTGLGAFFSTGIVLFVRYVAGAPLWVALLFPLLSYLGYGLLNVVGTLLGRREEERRERAKSKKL